MNRSYTIAIYALLIVLSLILQACPHYEGNTVPNREAWIYAPMDSTYCRLYPCEVNPPKEERILLPNKDNERQYYLVSWFCPESYNKHTAYNEEYHNLHIRRITEKGDCYVLLGYGVKINGVNYTWQGMYISKSVSDTLKKEDSPYPLTQVIDSMKKQCPDRVFCIKGKEEQSIYSSFRYSDFPSITIQ